MEAVVKNAEKHFSAPVESATLEQPVKVTIQLPWQHIFL